MANKRRQSVISSRDILKVVRMISVTLGISLVTSYWFTPVYGRSTTPGDDSDSSSGDDSDEKDGFGRRRFNYLWPFMFALLAAGIFGTIYSCAKNGKCKCKRNSQPDREAAPTEHNTERPGAIGRLSYFNDSYDAGTGDTLPPYEGGSALPSDIEMVPPPYCEKPPEYQDIYKDVLPRIES